MAILIADPLSDPLYYLKHFDFMLGSLKADRDRFLSAAQQATMYGWRMRLRLDVFLFVSIYAKGIFFARTS